MVRTSWQPVSDKKGSCFVIAWLGSPGIKTDESSKIYDLQQMTKRQTNRDREEEMMKHKMSRIRVKGEAQASIKLTE